MPMRSTLAGGSGALFVCAALVICGAASASAQTCDPATRTILNRGFQRLTDQAKPWNPLLVNAFAWVDNIDSQFFGGYAPFDIYVLVGRIYPPFSTTAGRLTRDAFMRLSDSKADLNNDRTGPLRVPSKFGRDNRLTPAFSIGKSRFFLRVVRVQTDRGGDNERVTVQVCRE
jgi:hypothetical protein